MLQAFRLREITLPVSIPPRQAGACDPRRRRHLFVILLVWCYCLVGPLNPVCPQRILVAQGNSLRLRLSYLPLIVSKLALICLGEQ
jgi:hypothetical protein